MSTTEPEPTPQTEPDESPYPPDPEVVDPEVPAGPLPEDQPDTGARADELPDAHLPDAYEHVDMADAGDERPAGEPEPEPA